MKRFASIVIFIVGGVGAFQWLSHGFSTAWEPRLRAYLEDNAGRITHTRVHIDSLAPSFFHRVRLLNVSVFEPTDPAHPIFQVSEIELTLSLIDLPRAIAHRQAYEAIGLITLKNPWIRLSRETLALHAASASHERTSSLPPWFTLIWEGGTLQWLDAAAPHGAWTMYQAQGAFRIRGPQMNFALRGKTDEAQSVRFQFGSLGRRWNAQFIVGEANLQTSIKVAETYLKRRFLPEGWTAPGDYRAEIQTSGREWPIRLADWAHYLQEASITFIPEGMGKPSTVPALKLGGTFTYKGGKITCPELSFESPHLDGSGRAEILLQDLAARPIVTFNASLPTGHVWKWPFQDAAIQARYVDKHWEFMQNTMRLLGGQASAKGTLSAEGADLAFTLEKISLAGLGQVHNLLMPGGYLNASASLKGPLDDWQIEGAWWLTDVQWNDKSSDQARGDFDITPESWQAQGRSEDSGFRALLDINRSEQALDLNRLEIHWPSGASLRASGHLSRKTERIQGTIDAVKISFPSDLPFLPFKETVVQAIVNGRARFGGSLQAPVISADLDTPNLVVSDQEIGAAKATIHCDKQICDVPLFHVEPGIDGQFHMQFHEGWTGHGALAAHHAQLGKWPLTQGKLLFKLRSGETEIPELSGQIRDTLFHWAGKVSWKRNPDNVPRVGLDGRGNLSLGAASSFTEMPFDLKGEFNAPQKIWQGQLHYSAQLLDGHLRGTYTLSGTEDHRAGDFSAQIANARWRAFQFDSDIDGRWSRDGFKPITVNGRLKSGGTFSFTGLLTPDAQAQGTLRLDNFNLHPLGESLKFPKPIEGTTNATLTLSGPLANPKWNGHLDGGPIIYASTSEKPFRLEHFNMDVSLAPLDSDPAVNQLTITEGQIKTAEELIRFRNGSFIDFAGDKPAHLSLGTDIRNLHLGIFTLFGGLDVDGTWQIKPEGFAVEAKAQTHSLFINDYELGEGVMLVNYYNGILQFPAPTKSPQLVTGTVDFHQAPQLNFTHFYISGRDEQGLQITGEMGPTHWDFTMVGRGLDMGILGELSSFPYALTGAADVQIHGTGDPKNPFVEGKVELSNGTAMGLSFQSGSAAFVWRDARITFSKLFLSDPGHYQLEGAGAFPLVSKEKTLAQDHSIDFSLHLKDSNLSLLKSFSSEIEDAKGAVDGILQIKGTWEEPDLHGSMHVTNGDVLGAHYFKHLKNANLAVDFEGDTLKIRDFRGKSGDGEFKGSGSLSLSGFEPSKYDLTLEITSPKGLDVQVPELAIPESPLAKRFKFLTTASRLNVRGHMSLRGPAEGPTISGEGIFSNGHFTFPPSRKNPPSPAVLEWFRKVYWDVNLKFQDGASFDNELVQAIVAGSLALKGPSDKLRVDGGLDINSGKISYLGLQFDIQQARYDIRSEVSGDSVVNVPYVRGSAESQIQAVDTVSGVAGSTTGGSRLSVEDTITLTIDYAPVSDMKPRLTSSTDPTLSQEKLLARVTQMDTENLTPAERTYLYQKQLVSLIDNSLTTPLAQNVLKKTGIADRLRVQHIFDPNAVTGQDLNPTSSSQQQQNNTGVSLLANTKYTIEKDLSNKLSVGYGVRLIPSVDPDLQQQQKLDLVSDVQLSYQWFRNVYLRGDFDLPNSDPNVLPDRRVTIEPRWRFGWWGNTNKDKQTK